MHSWCHERRLAPPYDIIPKFLVSHVGLVYCSVDDAIAAWYVWGWVMGILGILVHHNYDET